MKKILLIGLLAMRLITNEGVFNEGRRPKPNKRPPEVSKFIKRTAKRGSKKTWFPTE